MIGWRFWRSPTRVLLRRASPRDVLPDLQAFARRVLEQTGTVSTADLHAEYLRIATVPVLRAVPEGPHRTLQRLIDEGPPANDAPPGRMCRRRACCTALFGGWPVLSDSGRWAT